MRSLRSPTTVRMIGWNVKPGEVARTSFVRCTRKPVLRRAPGLRSRAPGQTDQLSRLLARSGPQPVRTAPPGFRPPGRVRAGFAVKRPPQIGRVALRGVEPTWGPLRIRGVRAAPRRSRSSGIPQQRPLTPGGDEVHCRGRNL